MLVRQQALKNGRPNVGRRGVPSGDPVVKIGIAAGQDGFVLIEFGFRKRAYMLVCEPSENKIHFPRAAVPRPVDQAFAPFVDIF